MSENLLRPDPRLRAKKRLDFVVFFALCLLPWVLLGLIPDVGFGWVGPYLLITAGLTFLCSLIIPVYVRSLSYELGEDALIVRRGVITHAEDVVPYAMITNIAIRRSPLDRLYDLGRLDIHTAGYSQNSGPEAKIEGIVNYEEVHDLIIERMRAAGRNAPAIEAVSGEATTESLLRDILAEVQALRQGK